MREIFVIDDDPQFQFIMELLLKAETSDKHHSSYVDPVKALHDLMRSYFQDEPLPHIIFLDLNMPSLSGWNFLDAINHLKGLKGEAPAVYILTSSIDPMDKKKAMLYSCVKGYISKPITQAELHSIVA